MKGDCDMCGEWSGALTLGVCRQCVGKFHGTEDAAPLVIGLAGPAGVGKSAAADYLVECVPQYDRASFADPLKAMLAEGLQLTADQLYGGAKQQVDSRYECTPRHIMQTLGTEWGRRLIHPDVWVLAMAGRVAGRRVIIDDVRFPNEAAFVRERGVLVHLEGRGGIEGAHVSETPLDRLPGDLVVRNDGDKATLCEGLVYALGI